MIWITADDVIALHSRVIQTSGSATVLASKLQSLLHYRHLEGKTCSRPCLRKSHDLATASLLITLSLTATSASAP